MCREVVGVGGDCPARFPLAALLGRGGRGMAGGGEGSETTEALLRRLFVNESER